MINLTHDTTGGTDRPQIAAPPNSVRIEEAS